MTERLTVVCWKWKAAPGFRTDYQAAHVNTLRAMVARHYRRPHEFVCLTDDPSGLDPEIRTVPVPTHYADLPGPNGVNCYRRLWAFSAEAADVLGPRFVSVDLDAVIVGDLAPLFDRPEDFVIWGDTSRSTPYNGSLWLLRSGTRRAAWETFHPESSPLLTKMAGLIGSDQAWLSVALGPGEPKWTTADGIYSWRVHLKRQARPVLPADARIVFFHGSQGKPWEPAVQAAAPWVAEHYR